MNGSSTLVKHLRSIAGLLLLAVLSSCSTEAERPPNIIFILADDLGYGELGSYGQQRILTPELDRLAAEGMRFTNHYSGSPVCAPSRDVLLTGLHTGHAYIRANDELSDRGDVWHDPNLEGQRPILENTYTLGRLMQDAGYVTGAIGKWGLGGPGSSGEPNQQGFDHWYGYLCQRVAHNYYPTHLWRNGEKDILEGNDYFFPHQRLPEDADPDDPASYLPYSGAVYSMDVLAAEALQFIRDNRERPFFLYVPFPVPHVSLQVPEESVDEYEALEDEPYIGDRGYTPQRRPRAAYAAMITRMDREIGRIMALLGELGIDDHTLVFFTSDNGPTFNGGTDSEFFNSAGPLRGLKTQLYEGGIRVPLIARWPGRIAPGVVSDHLSAFWDFMPTLAEIVGRDLPVEVDGVPMTSTLLADGRQEQHEYLYWEYLGRQAVRMGKWKAYRQSVDEAVELYDLDADIGERTDVAAQYPEIVQRIVEIMETGRTESQLFPLVR